MFFVGGHDDGLQPIDKTADYWKPNAALFGAKMAKPINAGPQHHYVAEAALAGLDRWVHDRQARRPRPRACWRTLAAREPPARRRPWSLDTNGNAKGGIRTPWVDAPTAKLSGLGNSGGPFGFLFGSTQAYDAATLARLYPGGKADYLKTFGVSLDAAVKGGFILRADAPEIRALAAAGWPGLKALAVQPAIDLRLAADR